MKKILVVLFLAAITQDAFSQAGLQQGRIYQSGEVLKGPVYGIESKVPAGWSGVLPMGTEVFLLVPDGINANGEIFVTIDSTDFDELKERWLTGLSLGNGNKVKSDGNITMRNGAMTSEAIVEGQGANDFKGYIESKCGEFGTCISFFLISPPRFYDQLKPGLIELSNNTKLVEPSAESIYDDFDWNAFLEGKYVANFDYVPGAKSENELWFCPDGSFKSKLKRTGLLKEDVKAFQGKKSGTWSTSSVGKTGVLTLEINKMQAIQLDLLIENDRIYINGKRYAAMLSDECK